MSMEMKKIALTAAIALLAGGAANADPMSWTEAGVGFNVADAGDDSADAFDIRGSIGFAGIGHAQLTYLDGTVDGGEGGADFDFDGFEVRAGVHPSVGDKTQVIAEVIYFDYSGDFDGFSGDIDSDGWGLGFGVRHQLGEQFEIRAQIDYFDGEADIDGFSLGDYNDTNYSFGGRYYWMPNLFTGVTVMVGGIGGVSSSGEITGSSGDVIRVDAGWSFGGDAF